MANELTLENVADDLDAVKTIMFTLARQYERIDRTVDRIAVQQESNTLAIADLTKFMARLGEATVNFQAEMLKMQSEIRGLQVENRRIFQRAFGEDQF